MTDNKDTLTEAHIDHAAKEVKTDEVKLDPWMDVSHYEQMTQEDLLKTAEKVIKTEPVQRIKKQVDSLKSLLFNALAAERKEKLEAFIADGNAEIDFECIQPIKEQFKKILEDYKVKRDAYYANLEQKHKENLSIRLGLIEELKALVATEETLSSTFNQFKEIQEKWRNAGPIAKADSSEIFRTFHHHVENFYDYVQINRELRDLDFQKNLEQKNDLIQKAESLFEEPSINRAFRELQRLHKIWKEQTGPVVKELREETWERFSLATKKIHERRHEHLEKIKEKQEENLEKKEALCQKMEALYHELPNSSNGWKKLEENITALITAWKTVGRTADEHNDKIWIRFREAQARIKAAKNDFYKELKKGYAEVLSKLETLVEKAEALKEDQNWKETSNIIKGLQAEWKTIKGAPRRDSEILWKRFREACNYFFEAMHASFEEKEKALEENARHKKDSLAQWKKEKLSENDKECLDQLKKWQEAWKALGQVPRKDQSIENEFTSFMNSAYDNLKMDRMELEKLKLASNVKQWLDDDDTASIEREKLSLRKKMQHHQDELRQLEANIQLFSSSSKGKNPLIAAVEKNISKHKKEIEALKQKMQWLKTFSKPQE